MKNKNKIDRRIDFTEDKLFISNNFNFISDRFILKKVLPIELNPIETQCDQMREFGFKILGGLENTFFLGDVSNFEGYKGAINEYLWFEGLLPTCGICGKEITVLDEGSHLQSISYYYPGSCRECINKNNYIHPKDFINNII